MICCSVLRYVTHKFNVPYVAELPRGSIARNMGIYVRKDIHNSTNKKNYIKLYN